MKINFPRLKKQLQNHLRQISLNDKTEIEEENPCLGIELPQEVFQVLHTTDKTISYYKGKQFYLDGITSTHKLLKIDENEWRVLEGEDKTGNYSIVYSSSLKIVLDNDKAMLVPCDDIVKTQELSRHADLRTKILDYLSQEIKYLRKQRISVGKIVVDRTHVYVVMENCGQNLEVYLQKNPNLSFDERIQIAFGIANEMQFLQQNSIVHADIKTGNICIKKDANGNWLVRLIDFGFSVSEAASIFMPVCAGTPDYMAPELFNSTPTPASDRWAFAVVIGELFGSTNLFKHRDLAFEAVTYSNSSDKAYQAFLQARHSFSGIFDQNQIPFDVDEILIRDLIVLLQEFQEQNAKERPPIQLFLRFLTLMVQRREIYRNKPEFFEFGKKIDIFFSRCNKLGIHRDCQEGRAISEVEKRLVRSHFEIVEEMLDNHNNRQNEINEYPVLFTYGEQEETEQSAPILQCEYPDPFTAPDEEQQKLVDDNLAVMDAFEDNINQLIKHCERGGALYKSNSSGIAKIRSIGHTPRLDTMEKLKQIQCLAKNKLTAGFWYDYSRSHFFGKGRHVNIELLYSKLNLLDLRITNIEELAMLNKDLQAINDFVEQTHCLHSKATYRPLNL